MKSKKLLTILIVFALLVVIIVVFASVFAVRYIDIRYHDFDGGRISTNDPEAPTVNDVLMLSKGKSILFLSKSDLIEQLNAKYTDWHAIGIVKTFPNRLEVHFVKRVAIVKIRISGVDVYLDSFGYVVDAPESGEPIDITSAISNFELKTNEKGKKLEFLSEVSNQHLSYALESIMALWQCKCDIEVIPSVLGKSDVFTFDSSGSMTIKTGVGAKIVVMSPDRTLTDKLIDAFSVYCDGTKDLQKADTVITVWPDGKVTIPDGKA